MGRGREMRAWIDWRFFVLVVVSSKILVELVFLTFFRNDIANTLINHKPPLSTMQVKDKAINLSLNPEKEEQELSKVDPNLKRGSLMSQNTNSTTPSMKL